jgi:ubiquinone biosynthesis protein
MTSSAHKTSSAEEGTGAEFGEAEEIGPQLPARAPSGSNPAVGTEGERTVTAARAGLQRLRRIVAVLTHHGFHQFVPKRGLIHFLGKAFISPDDEELAVLDQPDAAARRFRRVLETLGPTFMKLGQVLSTRPDVLPPAFIRELQSLQDDTPPVAFDLIRATVEAELGCDLDQAFAHFEREPLAAASIAQAHAARTREGDEVVVKVIRPGVEALIEADLDLLHLLARLLEASLEEMELYAPGELVETFDSALKRELDFGEEADVLEEFAANMSSVPGIAIPRVYRELSTARVLTLERFRGRKVTAVEPGTPAAKRLVGVGLEATFKQVFEDGLVHGDPHPGNVFVLDDGRLGLIDFGLVTRLSPMQRDTLIALLVSIVTGDIDTIARTVLRMGRPLGRIDMREFREVVGTIRSRHLRRSLADVDAARFLQDLVEAGQRFRIRIAPEYAVLAKATVTVEGVLRALDPDLDIVATARPFATRLMQARLAPRRLLETGLSTALSVGSLLREAPQQIDQLLLDLNAGMLRFEVRSPSLDDLGPNLNVLTTRLFMAILAAGLFVASAVLVDHEPWHVLGIPVATVLCLTAAIFFSFVGLAWHAVAAGSGKLSLNFLSKLLSRRRSPNDVPDASAE